jgi:hypothetical protein
MQPEERYDESNRRSRNADGTLLKACAWRWQRLLAGGVHASVSEVGDAENIAKKLEPDPAPFAAGLDR